ncbi:hypothetical protein PAXRUDRAFT_17481 [Paxillus rubicundulus Ve08.2h10]|uniref:Uncharacterized protein n=1 Tax=Paxillus rubicundulus Ve08.2h10 TaxID=930991 RepID=A0A0D0D1N7_9AGAM|nr:hypothetical protein PAXRUDRAFT_17481 [Paxillus rubicundulus Ve08.2h10]
MNQDNAAAASSGSSAAVSCALQVSGRGAVKALDLTGSVFRHKDDKKGQQDSLRYYLEAQLGYFSPWPDTSNSQYQSHCDSASAWLIYHPLYTSYLEIVMDWKDSRTYTNIKWNVHQAFGCPKTAEEMACLSMWGNCVGHPYMQQVRGEFHDFSNILDLSPLHAQLFSHLNTLAANIDLVLAPDATYHTAALDGKPFECLDAFYVVQMMAWDSQTYPHLHSLLPAFLKGATETLLRFTTKFLPDGAIARSTPAQRELACMETTNNANEGALDTYHVAVHCAPTMTTVQFNARLKYHKNQTGSYMKRFLNVRSCKYLHRKARKIDTQNIDKKQWLAHVEHEHKLVVKHQEDDQWKRQKREIMAAKLTAVVPCLTNAEIAKMKVAKIDLQIHWH